MKLLFNKCEDIHKSVRINLFDRNYIYRKGGARD